jgi:hypothetical protein
VIIIFTDGGLRDQKRLATIGLLGSRHVENVAE